MQNRFYPVILLIILAICCLGIYIAVTQFSIAANLFSGAMGSRTAPAFTPLVIVIATETRVPTEPVTSGAINPTRAPATLPNIALATLIAPSATSAPATATSRPNPTTPQLGTPTSAGCGSFQFCNLGGPPDTSLGPGSSGCSSTYIWGRVFDLGGNGLADKKIRFRDPQGELGQVITKGKPDIPGKFDIPAGAPGGRWMIWVQSDDGSQASPQVILTTQNYSGAGNCPNRIDFKQQR